MQVDAAVSISIYSFHASINLFQLCVVSALLSVGHNVLSGYSVLAFAIEQAEDELEHYDLLMSKQDLTRGCCTAAAAAACVVRGAPCVPTASATAAAAPSSATATAAVRVILHLNQVSQRALAQDVGKLFSASAAAAAAAAACAPSHMSPLRASLRSAAPTTAAAI
eukprot:4359-Heterococcus_DN1.PRE.1